jgi:LmbE family N-acetylglucosaminyl deacetylase
MKKVLAIGAHPDDIEFMMSGTHAQPHRNRDMMGRLITPNIFVDISSVLDKKTEKLSFHASQKD